MKHTSHQSTNKLPSQYSSQGTNPIFPDRPKSISYAEAPFDNQNHDEYFKFINNRENFDWLLRTNSTVSFTASTVVWFKNDLRAEDNPALFFGANHAAESPGNLLVAIYVFCLEEMLIHLYADCKILLVIEALKTLKSDLESKHGIPFIILIERRASFVPISVLKLCTHLKSSTLFFNKQYEDDEIRRDKFVQDCLLRHHQVATWSFDDQCVVPPGACKTGQAKDYRLFTPYNKNWAHLLEASTSGQCSEYLHLYDLNDSKMTQNIKFSVDSFEIIYKSGVKTQDQLKAIADSLDNQGIFKQHWKPFLASSIKHLANEFIEKRAQDYDKTRDFPSLPDATSRLSPYLAIGMISPKYLVLKSMKLNNGKILQGHGSSSGLCTWITEICWRDFYRNILVAFPHISKNRSFKLETEDIDWNTDLTAFEKWCTGQTGYPIVDAGMRQLNATGWMHNRLRMVTAMFLTKDLLIDWRWGEAYFMSRLIDGDFASNNGGWQWSASTGTDSQPYFRIFNPLLQSQRFDPSGKFIQKWCPELRSLKAAAAIHNPHGLLSAPDFRKLAYPLPIVDHRKARLLAIEAFKRIFRK